MTIQKLSIPKYWKIQEKKKSKFESKNQFRAAFIPPPAGFRWENIQGFSQEDIHYFQELLESVAHIILQLAREGGIEGGLDHAAGF
mgnify:CR=1 FL=1